MSNEMLPMILTLAMVPVVIVLGVLYFREVFRSGRAQEGTVSR